MQDLNVPVRWYSDGEKFDTLKLELDKTAFMIVDSDGGASNDYVEKGIAPALRAARGIGMRVLYIHNDFSLADEPGSIKREIHGTRWGNAEARDRPPPSREPLKPRYSPSIQPLPDEPDFPKREWSGFHETHVDYHLRCYGIKTLVAVGFSQRSCLYQTLNGAVEHNYRVIMLRDCTFSSEYPDTVDESLPEKGWLRKIMLRNFEHVVGYTSTSAEFAQACEEYDGQGG
jgi:nicotinamidase-related amidase